MVLRAVLNLCRCSMFFALILNIPMLSYRELNISEAALRDMNFTEAILNVFVGCTDVSDALLIEVYGPVNIIKNNSKCYSECYLNVK
jgi:hypothetical protein